MDDTTVQPDTVACVTLSDLIKQVNPYEEWLAPLDSRLCDGLLVAGIGMMVATILSTSAILSHTTHWEIALVALLCNATGLVLLGILGWKTDWFKAGALPWHRVGAAIVGLGVTDIAIMSVPVLIAAAYVLFWVVIFGLVAVFVVLFLFGALLLR